MQNIDWSTLGFKYMDTRCHVRHVWRNGAWDQGELVSDPFLKMHMAASCLHYGQAAFEGLKAFRCRDGRVRVFRPEANAERLFNTARRTCMAQVPVAMFTEAVLRVVKANEDYVPPYGTGGSLYIRPLLIGSGAQIGVAPADEYTFLVMVMPVGPYYKGGLKPVRALILDDYDRAAPQGMGDVKVAGNYAASLYAHESAKHAGYPVELYLDAKTHTLVEEFATSNFIGIKPDGTYVTPDSRSVLPSVTNNTLQQIAKDLGMGVEVRPVPYEELPEFSEIAACGTAVVVTPVCEITRGEQVLRVGPPDGCGPVLQKLYDTVQGIQYGVLPDRHGWCVEV
ncbi:MAG: branched-chain amino acid aminotransferase [Kiritimatiellia bacterium]|jgi:branched-chain amino acid aminotransferase|nr:branched-chain amino acid aminotransferase [Kiritimatiellia bacterium]